MFTEFLAGAPALEFVVAILLLPVKIIHDVTWGALNFLAFDVLQLGSFLPIQLG